MPRSPLRSSPKRPPLSIEEILRWADEWFAFHGKWPNINSGLIPGTIDDTWGRIDDGLRNGHRELPKSSGLSLARLLEQRRGVRNSEYPPQLSVAQIIEWAKAYHQRTGTWPKEDSGPIPEAPGETWLAMDMALRKGRRELSGRSSLARLLAASCGVRNPQQVPRLTITKILRWADAYYARHGKRPTKNSGPIPEAPDESWNAVERALRDGRRGLSGGSSLAKLLAVRRPAWTSPRFGTRAVTAAYKFDFACISRED
jgi:hypothetical protein